jgi:hypothetical protein
LNSDSRSLRRVGVSVGFIVIGVLAIVGVVYAEDKLFAYDYSNDIHR